MAGSRLEKFGTVFNRTRDLIRAGVTKQNDKPIWYDVYAAFPPKREPTFVSPPKRRQTPVDNVSPILYREDVIRAKFYDTYGSTGLLILYKRDHQSKCQRFVEKYLELQKSGVVSEDKLFEDTGKALLLEGITLRRPGVTALSNQSSQGQMLEKVLSIIDQMKHSDETDKSQPPSTPQ